MFCIGVDIGGMTIKAGLVDENGKIILKRTCRTRVEDGESAIEDDIAVLCEKVMIDASVEKSEIKGVGVGCPGTVNSATGMVMYASNLNLEHVKLADELRKRLGFEVVVNNDANCAALGETVFCEEKEIKDTLFITIGTGIGTGIIVNGKIFEGTNGEGAEGGHICIRMNGKKCSCGERGCFEAYASASALIEQTKEAMKKNPDSIMNALANEKGTVDATIAFEGYKKGDVASTKVVKRYVKYLATGTVSLVNIFRPYIVFIGGGVSNEGDYFIDMIRKEVKKHVFGGKRNMIPEVRRAKLGNEAGIVGAVSPFMVKR